jgi:hypothetical protein
MGPAPNRAEVVDQLIGNIRQVESGGNPNAVSPQDAMGSMQITKDTFNTYKKPGEVFTNEKDRVAAAVRKINDDYDFYGGDVEKVAAAYIGGRGAVRADGTIRDDIKDALGTTPAAYAAKVAKGIAGESKRQRFDVQMLEKLQSIRDAQREGLKVDPITYATRQGLVDPNAPGVQSFDTSKPDKLDPANMKARFDFARGMAVSYGAQVKPLTQAEVGLATSTLRYMTNDQKSAYFGAWAKAAGQDMEGYKAVMAQLAPDDPPTAIAGVYAAYGRATTDFGMEPVAGQPKKVSDLILAGQQILNPPKTEDGKPPKGSLIPMPPEAKMRLTFDAYIGNAYAGNAQANNAYYQTARAIYAKLSVDAGDKDTAVYDSDKTHRWESAIQLATGGIGEYRGARLPLPYGKTQDQFHDEMNRRLDMFIESGKMPPELSVNMLKNLPLKALRDGVYVMRAGDGIQGDVNGMPIVIDFNKSSYVFRMEDIGTEEQRRRFGVASPGKSSMEMGPAITFPTQRRVGDKSKLDVVKQ